MSVQTLQQLIDDADAIDIRLNNEQAEEFKRVIINDGIYPFAGYLPLTGIDLIKDITEILSVISYQDKLLAIEYPLREYDFKNSNHANIRKLFRAINDMTYSLILKKELAVSRAPWYGFYKDFFQIDVYPTSGRPVTTMPFIKDVPYIELTDLNNFIPVIRYASEGGGTYYGSGNTRQYQGTFYYLEPESQFMLNSSKTRTYRNKYAAFTAMNKEISSEDLDKIFPITWQMNLYQACLKFDEFHCKLEAYPTDSFDDEEEAHIYKNPSSKFIYDFCENLLDWVTLDPEFRHNFPYNCSLNSEQQQILKTAMETYFIKGMNVICHDPEWIINPQTNTFNHIYDDDPYFIEALYADEDRFDQPICLMARHLGIDCIILTHMIGDHRIVSEVMDSRSREESYGNIVRRY